MSAGELNRLAGVVTHRELARAGVTDARIRTLLRRQVLIRLGRGVYARCSIAADLAGSPPGARLLRVAAALVIAGPEAAASHVDAAVIHGLDMLDRAPANEVSVIRPHHTAGSHTGRAGIRVRTALLPPAHVTRRGGVRVTSVARTVVDLARSSPFRSGVVVTDSALHQKLTSKSELESIITQCSRWPGIQRARQVVSFSDALAESVFESIARVIFRDQGLPAPALQAWVGGDGVVIGRADFLWRAHRTIAEVDGALKYSDPSRARAQLQRDARLRAAGFEVVHITWAEAHLAPHQVAESIRAAFRRGAASA
jgi:hypothetical protein